MAHASVRFRGHRAVRLEAGQVSVVAITSVGPRILGLLTRDGRNALVELPDLTLPCPGSDPIHLRGGHRLWSAPEDPRVTYRPDDDPVAVADLPDGVRLTAPTDPVAGTQRDIAVRVTGPERLTVDHRVVNRAEQSQRLAPWAITMVPPGGRAWLPLLAGPFDEGGFQANRNIVLWPYTRLTDPRLVIGESLLEIRSDRLREGESPGPVKVGASLRRGWLAHWRDGILLVKRAGHAEERQHADMGASGQVYAKADFTELETLGPLVDLAPGGSVEHREDWEVHLVDEAEAEHLVVSGGLDR
ncbi:hypothetical protein BH23CHL8_BH23CHL8_00310 [soil metagenome]